MLEDNMNEKSTGMADAMPTNDSKDEMLVNDAKEQEAMTDTSQEMMSQDMMNQDTTSQGDMDQDDEPYEIKSENVPVGKGQTMETSAMLDNLMSDKDKVIGVATAFLFIIGSYINFWSIYNSDLGVLNQGNLFGGYKLAGILGKLCVILAVAYLIMMVLDQLKINWYLILAQTAVFIIQVLLILIMGGNDLGTHGIVVPGVGFFICVICIGVNLIFTRKLYRKGKQ